MNKLSVSMRSAIIRSLAEGVSIRATARLTGTARGSILKLLVEFGEFCSIYQDHAHRNLNTKRIEADEIWSFVGAKAKNATKDGQGDIWTYTALDADSKLMMAWVVSTRNHENTFAFMEDVASRLENRVQLTTDGLPWYVGAVENAFKWNGCDFAQIIKTYRAPTDETERQRRYSPMVCTSTVKLPVMGNPDMDLVSTSYVERQNLNIRMQQGRYTPLTNAFSKKAENHAHSFSMYAMIYNYCRPHQTLTKNANGIKTTPAMASGLTKRVWTVEEIFAEMEPTFLLHSN